MRFTRAAKVAAFPLLAMVLVVALIACQAGPPGKDATAVPGTTGTTGTTGAMGVNALNPVAGDDVIFNDKALPAVFAAADVRTIDLDPYFVGGNRVGIKYTMSPLPLPSGLMPAMGVAITDNMLVVTPDGDTAPAGNNVYDNRHVIIRATDADDRIADNVIAIRRNRAPTGTGTTADIRIGTQPDAIMATNGVQVALFGDLENWTCSSFNTCTLNLATIITDDMDDMLMYSATPADSDNFSVEPAAPAAMGITLTGKAATKAAVVVTTNAMDTGMLEVVEGDRPTFNVIVDAQPVKIADITAVTLERFAPGGGGGVFIGRAATGGLPAFFKDPEGQPLEFSYTYADHDPLPENDPNTVSAVVLATTVEFDHDGTTQTPMPATPALSVIQLTALNVGTTTVTVRATEPDAEGDGTGIGQYVEGSFTVTVNP
jgi:hypothetical protein